MKKKSIQLLSGFVVIVGVSLCIAKTLTIDNPNCYDEEFILSENIEALSDNAESQVKYTCKYNCVAGQWVCAWYNTGSRCTGCKKPK